MLEIKNAKKYFNKHKKNKVTAINDTSLTLEDTGLVALLGPSGSGKTTLLNAIGGLDKLSKGSIYIDGQKITSRSSYKVDRIRNLNIGYIFQDYKLIDNMSVYDNVALVLKMIGIKDKNEIKTRVEYVLDKVGMLRYKKRPAGMLSGGERQRVGIARAIVKAPDIILADEPTGNLDSKNSLEVMRIIRSIAKDRLVILVTHEHDLAKFYATRIIEIKDGTVVNDYANEMVDDLDYRLDNTFYLKDFENSEKVRDEDYDINIYSNNKKKVKLDIVVVDGNVYIRSNTDDKIEVIDDNSNIELVNDHYKKLDKKDIDKYKFDFDTVINKNIRKKYSSIFNPITLITNGFRKVFDYPILKKILLGGFLLSGMFLMYSVSSITATKTIRDFDFVKINKKYLTVIDKKLDVDTVLDYEKREDVLYLLPGDTNVIFDVQYKDFYQSSRQSDSLMGSLTSLELLDEKDLSEGKMPDNDYEVVVDTMALKKMFDDTKRAKMIGILDAKEIIGRKIEVNNMEEFTIVGITDLGSPSIYAKRELFVNILANSIRDESEIGNSIVDYSLYQDKITLKKGNLPKNDYEVIVNVSNQSEMKLGTEIPTKVNDKKLKVVGFYDSANDYNYYFVNNNTIKYNIIKNSENINIIPKDKTSVINYFTDNKLNIMDSYDNSKDNYIKSNKKRTKNSLLVAGIILAISLIEIYLMVRSSFLSRIKEIGIYRAIGVKKLDIYKMFFGEIVAITTIASVPGILFMAYILDTLSTINYISKMFIITIPGIGLTILFAYIFNLLVGLLPIFNVIRKTPSSILARHDLD